MKKVLTVFLSLQLILLPVAVAQDPTGSADQFRENPEAQNSSSIFNQLLALSSAIVGANALFGCKFGALLPSVKIFAIGSAVYVAAEIMGGKNQAEYHKKKISDLKMSEDKMRAGSGDSQRAALESALNEEKQNLSFINKRKMWMMAVTAIYYAAAGAAIMETALARNPLTAAGPPPNYIALCDPVSFTGLSGMLRMAVVAAFTMTAAKSAFDGIAAFAAALAPVLVAVIPPVAAALNPPEGRVAWFGVSAILATKVTMDMGSKAGVAKENISKLERVLGDFDQTTQSTTTSTIAGDATSSTGTQGSGVDGLSAGSNQSNAMVVSGIPDVQRPVECLGSASTGLDFSTSACKQPLNLATTQFDPSIAVPSLQATANLATQLGNALGSGNISGAEMAAGQLASKASAMRALVKDLEKQANKQLAAEGKNPIDVDGSVKQQMDSLVASVQGSLPNGGSGFGNTSLSGAKLATIKENSPAPSNALDVMKSSSAPVNAVTTPTFNELPNQGMATAAITPKLSQKLEEYEQSENDISNRAEDSIFNQVSNRYQKALDRILERKE
jgi:hypothetical protein